MCRTPKAVEWQRPVAGADVKTDAKMEAKMEELREPPEQLKMETEETARRA